MTVGEGGLLGCSIYIYMYIDIYVYIYICIHIIHGSVWIVDTELEISATQVSGPIGLQVGKVQPDRVSWPKPEMWTDCLQISEKNDENPWLFPDLVYSYGGFFFIFFPCVYWRVAIKEHWTSFFFAECVDIMGIYKY